jgi:hypothetical protein
VRAATRTVLHQRGDEVDELLARLHLQFLLLLQVILGELHQRLLADGQTLGLQTRPT